MAEQVIPREAILEISAARAEAPLETIEALVAQHTAMLFRVAYSILRNHHDAEDAVQECFLRVLKYGKRLQEVRNMKTWLARIAWTVALDRRSGRTASSSNSTAHKNGSQQHSIRRIMKKLLLLMFVFALVSASPAQQPSTQEAAKSTETAYKLSFKIYEMEDGKRINERSYVFPAISTLPGQRTRSSSIKVGVRTPLVASEHDKDISIQYLDVGLNLDCALEDVEGKLTASISVEMSSFALPEQAKDPRLGGDPVIRQQKQVFRIQLPLGKPVLVTSLDDINSKKRTQIEVTATRFE